MASLPAFVDDGQTRLVAENGERNLWDDTLDEQLAKCPPVAFLQQHALDAAPHVAVAGSTIAATRREESLRSIGDGDDAVGVQHTHGTAKAEEAGLSAAAGPKNDDVPPPPSRCLSEQQPAVACSSNGTPLGVKKAAEMEPAAGVNSVTPATASGPREMFSGSAGSAALTADSAALTADFATLVADSAALAAGSAVLPAAYAASVAVVAGEDLAPFPGVHRRPIATEETGVSTTEGPKDDDVTPAPSLCRPENEPVVANNSNGALLGVKKAVEVGPATEIDSVTLATTSGRRENSGPKKISSEGPDLAAMAADSALLTADFAALVTDSAALATYSDELAADYAAPVAVVMEEDQAPLPGAHQRPIETEEAGISAAAEPKDDATPTPSLSPCDKQPVVAYRLNGASSEVKEAAQVGHSTEPDSIVTPTTTAGPKELSSRSTDSAVLSADSAASVGVIVDFTAAPVAVAAKEEQAPFSSAHLRAAKTEEAGMPADAKPTDDDVTPTPSFRLSEEESVVAFISKGAPLGVRKAEELGPGTVLSQVIPATTSGSRKTSGPKGVSPLGADSAALNADSTAAAVVVAAEEEEDKAPFLSAHPRPSTKMTSVRSTPPELGARRMERRTVGVDRPSKGFRGGHEKEKRSPARECRPLEVNAPSIIHADNGALSRGACSGVMERSGSRDGRLKDRCCAEEGEGAARGGSDMAADKKRMANRGGM